MKKLLRTPMLVLLFGLSACGITVPQRSDLIPFVDKKNQPLSDNSCVVIMARSGFFIITDLPFIVCKTKNESTQIKCKNKDSKSPKKIKLLDLNQTNPPNATQLFSKNNIICKDPTVIKTITTQYTFPPPVISGGWGSASSISAATIGAIAAVEAARIK